MEHADRIRGAWLGLVAGDRIGGPLRMALVLGDGLLERQAFEGQVVLDKYLDWWRQEGFDTGMVVQKVFKHIDQGIEPKDAVLLAHQQLKGLTGGCNPMHRAMALALCPFLNEDNLLKVAMIEAQLSHFAPIAGEASQAYLLLLYHIVHQKYKSLEEAIDACQDKIPYSLWQRMKFQVAANCSRGGYAPDVLESALYFLRDNRDFRTSLGASLGFAGMENFSPVIVGAIAGALYGANSIPENALHHCKILPRVTMMADKFIKLWES
jgi:ADP-ribosylglycohydrolase